jgi:RNA polymerase sigma factor (sigma-70 family)
MAKRQTDLTEPPSDGDLTLLATKGDSDAFEELYRRHAEAAWRVAYAVTGNPHDASDAVSEAFTRVFAALPAGRFPAEAPFRPYLLAATRNAAIDGIRRTGRLLPSEMDALHFETAPTTPADSAVGALDASLVATAFLSLPERWRSVLWLTEVEGLQPREIADMLGVSANGAAQLAVRARNGLREQFLQAHLRAPVKEECRFTVGHLGAYVGGGLSARDVAKVDQHLAGCESCRARQQELEDVGSTLRKVALPIPLGLGALAAARWKLAAATGGRVARGIWSTTGTGATRAAVRPLAVASGLMLALGIIGAAVVGPESGSQLTNPSRRAPQEASGRAPVVTGFAVAPPVAVSAIESVNDVANQQAARDQVIGTTPGGTSTPQGGSTPPSSNPNPTPPAGPAPLLQVTANVVPAGAAVALGDQCTGVDLAGIAVIGCPPAAPTPTAGLLTVDTDGSLLGDHSIAL